MKFVLYRETESSYEAPLSKPFPNAYQEKGADTRRFVSRRQNSTPFAYSDEQGNAQLGYNKFYEGPGEFWLSGAIDVRKVDEKTWEADFPWMHWYIDFELVSDLSLFCQTYQASVTFLSGDMPEINYVIQELN